MLAHVDVGETVLSPPRLNLQECKERTHLFFDGGQTNEVVEFLLDLLQGARGADPGLRTRAASPFGQEVFGVSLCEIACFEQALADVV